MVRHLESKLRLIVQGKGNLAQKAAATEQGNTTPPVTANQAVETRKYPNPCGDGQAYQDSELCAQWIAATAARDTVFWDRKSYNIEVYGAMGIGVSLFFSALAAILAVSAYRSTKRTEVAQTRAYLFPDSVNLADGSHHEIEGDREMVPGVVILVKNYGSTPAREVRHWAGVVITSNGEEADLPEPDTEVVSGAFCAPGAALTFIRRLSDNPLEGGNTYCLTDTAQDAIRAGALAVVVYGRIKYKDIYGQIRTTDYRLGYAGKWPPPPNASMTFSSRGNSDN